MFNTDCSHLFSPPSSFFSTDADALGAGFVPDGSECGTDRACLDRQCVLATELTNLVCPTGSNGLRCSGNGVGSYFCDTHVVQCHCQ